MEIQTTAKVEHLFQQATQAHQAKQWRQAAECYQQVLTTDPQHANSLHLLGLVYAEQQQLTKALELVGKALSIAPYNPIFYCNRAQIYRRLNQPEQAIQDYQQALLFAPRRAETYTALAETYLAINRSQEAILQYLYACYLNPQQPVSTHHHLGNAFLARGHLDAAVLAYEKALTLNPQSVETLSNLGVIYAELHQLDRAVAYHRQAININPHYADGYINLGLALSQQNAFAEAEEAYQQALKLNPQQQSVIQCNRGLNYQAQGEWQNAQDCFTQSLNVDSNNAKARFNLATLALLQGDLAQGWAEYEARFNLNNPNHPVLKTTQPNWQGEDLQGKTLLVYCEQGLGDTLQFIRYLPLLKQRGARLLLQTQPALISFLATQTQLGIEQCFAMGQTLPAYDYYVPLMSLPQRFQTQVDNIPAANGYLQVPVQHSLALPAANASLRVGLVWAGNPQHKNNHRRSISLKSLIPLLDNPFVQFYSLQYGSPQTEIQQAGMQNKIIDLSPQLKSWIETAQLINQLDLIITVDTAIAHLSGALNKPTWLLLPFIPDFRWLLDRTDTPWYNVLRLFRQTQRDDWESVIHTIKQALQEYTTPHKLNS
jgi:tetratricopeptide (TPR) repeat protein